jgi:hypothetical protein
MLGFGQGPGEAVLLGVGFYPQDLHHQRQFLFAFLFKAIGLAPNRRAADAMEKPLAADKKDQGDRGKRRTHSMCR